MAAPLSVLIDLGVSRDLASLLLDDFKGAVAHLGEHPVTVPMSKEESTGFNHLQNRSQGLTSDRSK